MKLLVLLLLPCLSLSEVVKDFAKCNQFFLKNKPPQFTVPSSSTALPVKEICQCVWDDSNQKKYLYATLYNTDWKIPIYSAYVFKKSEHVRSVGRCDVWYIEPQLDGDANAEACMAPKGRKTLTNQAVNCDYDKSGYDRGHLYPVHHTDNHLSMLATSTLTNAAPQDPGFNQGQWKIHEADVIKDLKDCDSNSVAYVVTGVVPDHNIPKIKIKEPRVTVSKYYWRAFCCLQKNSENRYIGQGYIGPVGNNKIVQTLSVTHLQTQLATEYRVNNIVIFPGLPAPPPLPPPPNRKRPQEVEDPSTDDDCN